MKINSLHIKNFKSLEELNITATPGINVIAGVNGAGKSSLLHAIEIALSWAKARMRQRTSSGIHLETGDIRHGADFTSIGVRVTADNTTLNWSTLKVSPFFRGQERPKADRTELTEYTDLLMAKYFAAPERINLPMFVKYSVNRSLIDIPAHVHKKHLLSPIELLSDNRLDGGNNLRSFYEWFREREDIEREIHETRHSFDYEDPQLHAVRRAISTVMEGYGDLHTRRRTPTGFELRKHGETFRVEELSDGEKCYLTLIGDIARRLAIFNPAFENPCHGEGIILIDELELHLHPSWQSEAVDKLRSVFPYCQFFITTHSPHIVQNLQLNSTDSLTMLVNGSTRQVGASYGQPVDDVLREVFGLDSLRPAPVKAASEKVWTLLNDGVYESPQLTEAIQALRTLIADSDPEFATIKRQIILNRRQA